MYWDTVSPGSVRSRSVPRRYDDKVADAYSDNSRSESSHAARAVRRQSPNNRGYQGDAAYQAESSRSLSGTRSGKRLTPFLVGRETTENYDNPQGQKVGYAGGRPKTFNFHSTYYNNRNKESFHLSDMFHGEPSRSHSSGRRRAPSAEQFARTPHLYPAHNMRSDVEPPNEFVLQRLRGGPRRDSNPQDTQHRAQVPHNKPIKRVPSSPQGSNDLRDHEQGGPIAPWDSHSGAAAQGIRTRLTPRSKADDIPRPAGKRKASPHIYTQDGVWGAMSEATPATVKDNSPSRATRRVTYRSNGNPQMLIHQADTVQDPFQNYFVGGKKKLTGHPGNSNILIDMNYVGQIANTQQLSARSSANGATPRDNSVGRSNRRNDVYNSPYSQKAQSPHHYEYLD